MHLFNKLAAILAICAILLVPFPKMGLADTAQVKTDTPGVTANKPQFHNSPEEYLPGAEPKSGKPSGKSMLWIAAAAVAIVALAIGAAGSGGGDSGGGGDNNQPSDNDDTGGVGIEW